MVLSETASRTSASPESLISRIASGERSAEQQLVAQYWRGLLYILNKRTKDPQLANDLAQETFLTVILKARNDEIRNPEALTAFIRQVGLNLLIAYFRKEKGHKTDKMEDLQVEFPDSHLTLTDRVHHKHLVEAVIQVIKEMPSDRDTKILNGFYIHNTSKKALCEQLDLSSEHFDRVLYRAKDRLRQILSMKLGVNLNKSGLSHLLTVAALTYATQLNPWFYASDQTAQVGDSLPTTHYRVCTVKNETCNQFMTQRERNNVTRK